MATENVVVIRFTEPSKAYQALSVLEAKDRAGLRVEDEIADVDKTADRRHDPEGDSEHVLHAHLSALPICSLSLAAVWS